MRFCQAKITLTKLVLSFGVMLLVMLIVVGMTGCNRALFAG